MKDDFRVALDLIIVTDRARKKISQEEIEILANSIVRHTPNSLLHPIVVEPEGEEFRLIAGERRFRAYQYLAKLQPEYRTIPARRWSSLRVDQRKVLELEENLKRTDLAWQDEALAILAYYEIRTEQFKRDGDGDFSIARLSGELQRSDTSCSRTIQVARALRVGDKRLLTCDSIRSAGAVLARDTKRAIENELITFGEEERKRVVKPVVTISDEMFSEEEEEESPPPFQIVHSSFSDFVDSYVGPPFNFVHCDFPYGLNISTSAQFNTEKFVSYTDDPEDYLDCLSDLNRAIEKGVISKSAHVLFWFPMSKYVRTRELLADCGISSNDYPLIWVKSDKSGIIPDATRYPRRVYETALLCSIGDRKIIKPLFNASVQPSAKGESDHASYKPRLMLLEFLPMFIDADSMVLDPTCGSGSALGVSIELGAKFVVGVDSSDKSIELATQTCRAALIRKDI